MTKKAFAKWIDTFVAEKGIDLDERFNVVGASGVNSMDYRLIINLAKDAPAHEQAAIKHKIVAIDFRNGDVKHFLRHLGAAIAI